MPQEFHVLQCYSCESFQVDIIKKVPKWCCKMCGKKQSVIKVFAKGNGKECRLCVQELNEARIKSEDLSVKRRDFEASVPSIKPENDAGCVEGASKWTQFLENEDNSDSDDNNAGRSKRDESGEEKLKKRKCNSYFEGVECRKRAKNENKQGKNILEDDHSLNFTDNENILEDKGVLKRQNRNETLKKNSEASKSSTKAPKRSKWDEFMGDVESSTVAVENGVSSTEFKENLHRNSELKTSMFESDCDDLDSLLSL